DFPIDRAAICSWNRQAACANRKRSSHRHTGLVRSEVRGIWFDLVTAIPAPHDEANTCGSRGTEGHSETNGPLYPHGPAAGGPQGALVRIDLTGGSGPPTNDQAKKSRPV